ncbi:MAG: hypothetical protein KGL44_12530 [Sphingomonadales bacterium]|nr:hypothetical protein [Sphingomonadales bacterium]
MGNYELISSLAWPGVALIAIIILGPGGVLNSTIGELANKLMSINSSVKEFKNSVADFNESQRAMASAVAAIRELDGELAKMSGKLETIRQITTENAIEQGKARIAEEVSQVGGESGVQPELVQEEPLEVDQMHELILQKWSMLTELLRERVGAENYDGRAIGQMARMLADKRRRVKHIEIADAELIEGLHSQYKRFVRLTASRAEWLTSEVYLNFVQGVDRAISLLT